jgi:phosphoenolpyruvate-protein kinase (PTS system EI component)
MEHPAELAVHQYMENAVKGYSTMSDETIEQVATDVADALKKQFGSGKSRGDFHITYV